MTGAVLVIDDDPDVLHAARLALAPGVSLIETAVAVEGLDSRIEAEPFDVILLDMNFALGDHSGREGLDWLARIQAVDPAISVVLMTTYGGVALAVDALKRGAADFVLKPWRNDKLAEVVDAAVQRTQAKRRADADLDLDRVEREAISRALARHGGNISQAAIALGLTRPALYRRMAKHGL